MKRLPEFLLLAALALVMTLNASYYKMAWEVYRTAFMLTWIGAGLAVSIAGWLLCSFVRNPWLRVVLRAMFLCASFAFFNPYHRPHWEWSTPIPAGYLLATGLGLFDGAGAILRMMVPVAGAGLLGVAIKAVMARLRTRTKGKLPS